MTKIYSVCWNITEKCNENCKFCYRTISPDLSLESNKKIADKLIEHGVEKITFAGGEPLLYPHLFDLAEYIKNKVPSILLSLTTNGLLINDKNAERIINMFDWITFDLEAPNSIYHENVGRGRNHFNKTLENLNRFNNKLKIKINTVATKLNLDFIPDILTILDNYNIQRWKIFRYYPVNFKAIINRDMFMITDEEFLQLEETVNSRACDSGFIIQFNDYDDFKTTYFSIFPNGELKDNSGRIVSNMVTNTIDECIASIDLTNHTLRRHAFSS